MIGEGAVNFLLPFCTVDFFHFISLLFLTAINLLMCVSCEKILQLVFVDRCFGV
jgi:hypothetical protein